MLSLWLNKGMFWVSAQRLIDQANTIDRNSWITELEIEELERNLPENDSYKEEERSADDTCSNLGEEVRDILASLEADEEIANLEEEEVVIIEEIAGVLERRQKDKLPALRDTPKKKLLEETVNKVLCKFKTHSITKTNVRHWQTLERKYSIRVKTLGVVIEELKQRIVAIAAKVRRYQKRVDRFRKNRMFQNNQRKFYREVNQKGERCDDDQPDPEESKKFWGDME